MFLLSSIRLCHTSVFGGVIYVHTIALNAVYVAMDVYTEILSMFERNYPETLSRNYVINGMMINICMQLVLFACFLLYVICGICQNLA